MNVGVRFCGGCNPRYDRGQYYKDVMARYPQHRYETAREGVMYDFLLVIGGCPACCADYSPFTYRAMRKSWEGNTEISELT